MSASKINEATLVTLWGDSTPKAASKSQHRLLRILHEALPSDG